MKFNIRKSLSGLAILSLTAGFSAHAAYPKAKINNRAPYPATGTITYVGPRLFCKSDNFSVPAATTDASGALKAGFWQAKSRGACLINRIDARFTSGSTVAVTSYTSSGTSYGNFILQPTQDDFRVYSDHELKRETASSTAGKSPGFRIQNKTLWPVSVALEQVGCLYYQTLRPGEIFDRRTGAVWFTITASISPTGEEPRTDEECIKPAVKFTGTVVLAAAAVVMVAGTGGAAAPALVGAGGGTAAAAAPVAVTGTKVVITKIAAQGGLFALGTYWEELVGVELGLTQSKSWWGQYAGPEWPFRCAQKPTYVITGGWGPQGIDSDGNFFVDKGQELRLTKTNSCGNGMMAFTKGLVSSPPLPPIAVAPPQILPTSASLPPAQNAGLTDAAILGDYALSQVQNAWHEGTISKSGTQLRWTNKAGVSWSLNPNYASRVLATGTENPYYAQYPQMREFKLVVANGRVTGFNFGGSVFQRQAASAARPAPPTAVFQPAPPARTALTTEAAILGSYVHSPTENAWHEGTITKSGTQLRWTNKAGVSWSLDPNYATGVLTTGTENPYYAQYPQMREFKLIISNGRVMGFNLGGGIYQHR